MDQEPKDQHAVSAGSAWLRFPRLIAVIAVAALLTAGLILAGYSFEWTGFATYTRTPVESAQQPGEVVQYKTLWDWLELLIIPATLLVGGYLLNRADKRREDERAVQSIQEDREIAEQRTQETALQTYLDQMAKLLIENALGSTPIPEAKDVARVWTLTVVRRIDAERKGIVLQFLHESKLIQGDVPIVNLLHADLRGAGLSWAELNDANLRGADLRGADLRWANLRGANLSEAELSRADLRWANLKAANLRGADFSEAQYNAETVWPGGFDPAQAGARLIS
jgi:hypothetical protein